MEPTVFRFLGVQHVSILILIFGLTLAVSFGGRHLPPHLKIYGGRIMGGGLLWLKGGEWAYALAQGYHWEVLLPLHLCDMAALVTGLMLITGNYLLYEIAYFWSLAGSTQALITPALSRGFPHADFLFFFGLHGGVVMGVMYATFALGMRPVPKSILKAFAATAALALIAVPVNLVLETNYLFLCRKPGVASLLDYLGPWPWYVVSLIPLCGFFLLLVYSPFYFKDRLGGKR